MTPHARRETDEHLTFAEARRRFPRKVDAFYHFAGAQFARHPLEAAVAARRCCLCGRGSELRPTRLTWRVAIRGPMEWVLMVAGAIGSVSAGDDPWHRFITFHPICKGCFRSWRWSRIGWDVVAALGTFAVCAGALAAILGLSFGYFGIMNDRDTRLAIQTGWAGVLVLVAGAGAMLVGQRMRIPEQLRVIGSRPVELESAAVVEPEINALNDDD